MAAAQSYNPREAFIPDFYKTTGNACRSAAGVPGSGYWQNRSDYTIEARFDTATNKLSGTVRIVYTNNSPDMLQYLWLELDQNVDRADARSHMMTKPGITDTGKGFTFSKVRVLANGTWQDADYLVEDTRMQVRLRQPLPGDGASLTLQIAYSFELQAESAAGRAGFMDAADGRIYVFGYWFPRMCVYDDLHGWNTLSFIGGGEFYLEYGDIDYKITAPSAMLAVGAGELVNGNEILNDKILEQLSRARQSDSTVIIRSATDVKQKLSPTKKSSGTTTWHFRMEHTRDVAFALSEAFVWDGARINLPAGKAAFAQSVYPPESMKAADGWPRATEFLKASVEIFSRSWLAYPYPEATNVAGPVGGMEFPGLTFDWHDASGKKFWSLISHEIGHTWYPMIVGSDERRYPFMDEGFNTFIDIYAQELFNGGEFAPKRDGEYAPGGGNPADEIIPVIKELEGSYTLMDRPDGMDYKYVHPLFYFKTAFGLVLLREVILGQDRFDYAFRRYTHDWAFKHPAPADFFRAMDNAAGEDLTWFWNGWFCNNWLLDQAVTEVKYEDGDIGKGALITIENKNKMVMPVLLEIREANGQTHDVKLPVEIWQRGSFWTFRAPTTSKVTSVVIDPRHQLPDVDRSNNEWKEQNL